MLTSNIAGEGVFIRCLSLARQLAPLGYSVTLVVSAPRAGWRKLATMVDGVTIISVSEAGPRRLRNSGLSLAAAIRRAGALRLGAYDLVHVFGHRPTAAWPALFGQRKRGWRVVADWSDLWSGDGIAGQRAWGAGWLLGRLDDWWGQRLRARADMITVISTYLGKLAAAEGAPPQKVALLPPGANVDIIRPLPQAAMRRHYDLPQKAPVVVHAGYAAYDADLLARSYLALARRRPGAYLLLTGGRWRAVNRRIQAEGKSAQVVALGSLAYERLGEVLACGDAMLLPYTNRPINLGRYPNKLGDYLAAGRPVITNPTGDLGRFVAVEGVGLVVEEDGEAFAEAAELLAGDAVLGAAIGRRARQVAEDCFSWRLRAQELDRVYRRILES
jgi:glycosyltransferase involved in cell wall biosynthesis